MTRDSIISKLYQGRNFLDCINKMEPAHLRDDLKQEVITVVCGWDDDKIKKLHHDGALEFYVVRVILNHIQSKTSPFYKKYRMTHDEYDPHAPKMQVADACDTADRQIREDLEDLALEHIDSLYWYDAELLRMYMRLGNFRAIQKETGIPFISCYKNIQKSIAILRARVVPSQPEPVFTREELRQIQTPNP